MPAKVIAEIGCNHGGNIDTAYSLIEKAAHCGADVVKFQKRNPRECLTPEEYRSPHPNPAAAYGPTYGQHREALEFSAAEHVLLQQWCESLGVDYSTSVWDVTSAWAIIDELEPNIIKVPSACNLNKELLEVLAEAHPGTIHLSLGMTTRREEQQIVEFFEAHGRAGDLVLYACTSGYPVAFEDVALGEITRLRETYGHRVAGIGFSGHHLGIAADIAALALGAEYIERHFTLDRTWRGTDHAASLEPGGLRRLCRDVRHVELALPPKREEILPVEQEQRQKLKRGRLQWTR